MILNSNSQNLFCGFYFLLINLFLPTLGLAAISANMINESRKWTRPNYKDQDGALGYNENAFVVSEAFKGRVQFWKDIYTKYSSHQGVIHDIDSVEIVYDDIDFRDIDEDEYTTGSEKVFLREQRLDRYKDRILRKWAKKKITRSQLRFQQGLSDKMEQAIFLSGRYLEMMEKVFVETGLPKELTRLVFVESSFNILARSKVGASGLWQIMPGTVKYKKMIHPLEDLRNHPLEATKIAAEIMQKNYQRLESWPLAITAYNHGVNGVEKIVETYHSKDLSYLIENVNNRRSFGFASKNFYASFLAALAVEKNANKYFPNVKWAKPLPEKKLVLPGGVKYREMLSWFSGNEGLLQIFNPQLTSQARKKSASLRARSSVSVPKEKFEVIKVALAQARKKNGIYE